ncbi:hypothetical protein HHL22_08420 [Hymenobacter sp. RP-2-7]|uniref:Uncharacterized protein n=1 Tax=Hymenobacter polaris TaxID=2682546 RepID=A0A7Y0ADR1_9BACT|nr:hypothetical protein [Hymenobacter polaris]NML65225.1 hypothetical protein [Hymenobacter polaris]
MSLTVAIDDEYIKAAAIASFKASLAAAENSVRVAQNEYTTAKQKLEDASNLVNAFKSLLAGVDATPEVADQDESAPTEESDEEQTHLPSKKRRLGGIDAATLQQLEEAGEARTSDELVALVANAYSEPISPKSVKNALGEFVKSGKVIKQYSKSNQAYYYSISSWISTEANTEENEQQKQEDDLDLGF